MTERELSLAREESTLLLFRGLDANFLGRVIAAEKVVGPGRGVEEVPVRRRYDVALDLAFLVVVLEPVVGLDPDTLLLIRVDLAPALETAAAGAVALVLGTLRHRANIGDICQGAVAAVHALEKRDFRHMLHETEETAFIGTLADTAHETEEGPIRLEADIVHQT